MTSRLSNLKIYNQLFNRKRIFRNNFDLEKKLTSNILNIDFNLEFFFTSKFSPNFQTLDTNMISNINYVMIENNLNLEKKNIYDLKNYITTKII